MCFNPCLSVDFELEDVRCAAHPILFMGWGTAGRTHSSHVAATLHPKPQALKKSRLPQT